MNLVAQAAGPPVPGLDVIGGTVLGAVLILMLFGWLWAKPPVDDLRAEVKRLNGVLDRKDEELATLRESFDEKVIPVIDKNTQITDRVVRLLEERGVTDEKLLVVLARLDGGE